MVRSCSIFEPILVKRSDAKADVPMGDPRSLMPSVVQGMVKPCGVVRVGGAACSVAEEGRKTMDSCGLSLRFASASN